MNNLISIIIPVYNHAQELRGCLESLKHQTIQNFELIIIDDGSADGVAAVAEDAKHTFTQCVFMQQQNRGAPAARNRGADMARGGYFLFLDADITLKPHALEHFLQALEDNPHAAFSYSVFYFGFKLMRGVAFDPERLKQFNYIHTSSLLRANYFSGFDESLKRFQDWDLWLTVVKNGGVGVLINEPLFKIKPRATGMSTWLPSLMYRLPWHLIGWMPAPVRTYIEAQKIIRAKHEL